MSFYVSPEQSNYLTIAVMVFIIIVLLWAVSSYHRDNKKISKAKTKRKIRK